MKAKNGRLRPLNFLNMFPSQPSKHLATPVIHAHLRPLTSDCY